MKSTMSWVEISSGLSFFLGFLRFGGGGEIQLSAGQEVDPVLIEDYNRPESPPSFIGILHQRPHSIQSSEL